jgi:hypothetical protein
LPWPCRHQTGRGAVPDGAILARLNALAQTRVDVFHLANRDALPPPQVIHRSISSRSGFSQRWHLCWPPTMRPSAARCNICEHWRRGLPCGSHH